MQLPKLKKNYLSIALISITLGYSPYSNADDEFDLSFLHGIDGQTITAEDIKHLNNLKTGMHIVDVRMNDYRYGKMNILFKQVEGDDYTQACLTKEILSDFDFKEEVLKEITAKLDNGCLLAKDYPKIKTDFDFSRFRLSITIPRSLLNNRPKGYTDPKTWDTGVNSAFTNYQINHYRQKSANGEHSTNYINLGSGINLGAWRLRHHANITKVDDGDWEYNGRDGYAYRPLIDLKSNLKLGYFNTSSDKGSYSMRGVEIANDKGMTPSSLQGFAPIIKGTALTNATVKVLRNGHEIYNTTVPAGDFEIDDLYNIATDDRLELVVTEANGIERKRTIFAQAGYDTLRPNTNYWQMAVGQLRKQDYEVYKQPLLQGTWLGGINNRLNLSSGATLTKDYNSLAVGGVLNTEVGRFGLDTKFINGQTNNQNLSGQQYRLNYQKSFNKQGVNIYGYAEKRLGSTPSLSTILNANENNLDTNYGTSDTDSFGLRVHKNFKNRGGVSARFSQSRDHNSDSTNRQYELAYNNKFKKINYNLSARRVENTSPNYSYKDNKYSLSLNFPLFRAKRHSGYASVHDFNSAGVNLSGSFEDIDGVSYGLSAYRNKDNDYSVNANANYANRFASMRSALSKNNDYSQLSLGASGSLALHSGGLLASNSGLSENFAIVYAKDAVGSKVLRSNNQYINELGYGIVPSIRPYRKNTVGIDVKKLPLNVKVDNSNAEFVPTRGASSFVDLNTSIELSQLFEISLADGTLAPFGGSVIDESNNNLGFVTYHGRAYVSGLKKKGTIKVVWDDKKAKSCSFEYDISKQTDAIKVQKVQCL